MPNFPKSCSDCRRRRIKCDALRPSCKRCTEHGLECEGCELSTSKQMQFRNQTQSTVQETMRIKESSTSRTVSPCDSAKGQAGLCLSHKPEIVWPGTASFPSRPSIRPSVNRDRKHLQMQFGELFFPDDICDEHQEMNEGRTCSRQAPDSMMVVAAIDAICVVQLATTHRKRELQLDGCSKYAKAVHLLRETLMGPPNLDLADDTVAAVWIMHLCEVSDL